MPYQPEAHGYKSRQRTGSGGRLSASGITCEGYTEWTQNKKKTKQKKKDAEPRSAEGTPGPVDASWRVLSLFSFRQESWTANSRWTKRACGSSRDWHSTPRQICWGLSASIGEANGVSLKSKILLSLRDALIWPHFNCVRGYCSSSSALKKKC